MRRGLVRARVQVERDHQHTLILRGANVHSTISVRGVRIEEVRRDVVVQVDTMCRHRNAVDRLRRDRDHSLRRNVGRRDRDGVRRASRGDVGGHTREGGGLGHQVRQRVLRIRNRRELSPVLQIRLQRSQAETHEQGLNGPLQILEQHLLLAESGAHRLLAVDADQREANALNKDFVNFSVVPLVLIVKINLQGI